MKTATRRRALTVEMTSGSLWKNILLFSLPLMMTQVLEVLFNLSDVAIAGKYAYNTYVALGSVGSTTTLVTLFTGLLIGLGGGVNVAVARGLGMGNDEDVEHTTHSSFLICLAMGVLTCLVCVFFAEPMLRLLHTKEEFLPGAVLYLKLYALGLPAMGIYNCGNGILSATGDTKRPLLYLTVAGVLNVILNLVFVIGCGMAAEGVAIASAIAQWVSALLIIIHLLHRKDACRLDIRKLRLHHLASKRVLLIGIPSGLQNAIFAVANLFVQAGLNSFDEITVSGAAAAANADTLVFNMMAAFYTACASFVSRNWGAGRKERILKSYYISMLYAAVVGVLVGVLLTVFGREFLGLFADKPEVIDAGVDRLRIMAFSYWIGPLMDASIAASRGLGRSVAPHHYGHSGLLRVPGHLDLHHLCLLPHDYVPVSAVYVLLDTHRRGGVYLLPHHLQAQRAHCPRHMVTKKDRAERHGLFLLRRYCTAVNRAAMSAVTSSVKLHSVTLKE